MYRDGSNYKTYGHIEVDGELDEAQRERFAATLDDNGGKSFIPEQLGMGHLGHSGWSSFPSDDDHCWHEVQVDDIEAVGDSYLGDNCMATYSSADELLAVFEKAAGDGWDDLTYAIVPDEDEDDGEDDGPYAGLALPGAKLLSPVKSSMSTGPARGKTTPNSTPGSFAPRSYSDPGTELI